MLYSGREVMQMDVLEIAKGELGVKESPAGSNRVKYNAWYYGMDVSGVSYPWCMVFVQWCYDAAGRKLPYRTASCNGLLSWVRRNRPAWIVKVPQPGDIVIYDFGHTGIVEKADAVSVTCIEGNTAVGNDSNGGEVMRRVRGISAIKAIIRPERPGKEEETNMDKRINKIEEAPDWARETLEKLVRLAHLKGTDGGLDLSVDMVRLLVILDRAGIFGYVICPAE